MDFIGKYFRAQDKKIGRQGAALPDSPCWLEPIRCQPVVEHCTFNISVEDASPPLDTFPEIKKVQYAFYEWPFQSIKCFPKVK